MILGFKKEIAEIPTYFKEAILASVNKTKYGGQIHSIKHHTIRQGDSRFTEGDLIHFAYGIRTKDYDCFLESPCTHVTPIWIKRSEGLFKVQFYIRKEEEELEMLPMLDVCRNDGLLIGQFNDFFMKSVTKFPQKAHIIHWTKLRYERFN